MGTQEVLFRCCYESEDMYITRGLFSKASFTGGKIVQIYHYCLEQRHRRNSVSAGH